MMWTPTHIELVVLRARHLVGKGKAGTNDAYVVMQLGKAKYQTSVKDKAIDPEWNEECDFELPTEASAIELTVLHKDVIGLDKFLGRCLIMLADLDEYGMPLTRSVAGWVFMRGGEGKCMYSYRCTRMPINYMDDNLSFEWVELGGRHDNKDSKYRGELEVRLTCIVRNHTEASPEQGKLKKAAAVGSSIFNVANSVGNKLNTLARRAAPSVQVSHDNVHDAREVQDDVITQVEGGHASSLFRKKSWIKKKSAKQAVHPVVSDISLDTKNVSSGKNMLSKWQPDIIRRRVSEHRMSLLDLTRLKSTKSKSLERHNSDLSDRGRRATIVGFPGEPCYARGVGRCGSVGDMTFMNRNVSKDGRRQDPQVKPRRERLRTLVEAGARRHSLCSASSSDSEEVLRLVDAPDVTHTNAFAHFQQEQAVPLIPDEIISTYANMGKEELLKIVCHQWSTIEKKAKLVHALEDYIDDLLVKVIETTPRILQMADEKTKATKAHAERHHSIV